MSTTRATGLAAVLAAVAVVLASTSTARPAASGCGYERIDVKHLLDPAAARVAYAPRSTTVEQLRALPRPASVTASSPRLAPVELRNYSLHVTLVAVRRTATHDTVLAVRGKTAAATMLIYFPDTHTCLPDPGDHGGDIHSATDGLNGDCGPAIPSDRWVKLRGEADVEGVGFWEPRHATAQPWAAPNGITLHPALSFYAFDCRVAYG